MLYLASDHGGFYLKEKIKEILVESGLEITDCGNKIYDENDDFPDFAIVAVKGVLENPQNNRAILFCRSGTGEAILANRFKGIRAGVALNREHAIKSREHNDTNVLAIPSDYISEEDVTEIVGNWLDTKFSGEEKRIRRLEKIESYSK